MLIRVVVGRTALDEVVSGISKDDRGLVEGRLQITTVKNESGAERRIYEIDANTIEMMGGSAPASSSANSNEEIVTRNFLLQGKPDGILNIIDATNIERNLFLSRLSLIHSIILIKNLLLLNSCIFIKFYSNSLIFFVINM